MLDTILAPEAQCQHSILNNDRVKGQHLQSTLVLSNFLALVFPLTFCIAQQLLVVWTSLHSGRKHSSNMQGCRYINATMHKQSHCKHEYDCP